VEVFDGLGEEDGVGGQGVSRVDAFLSVGLWDGLWIF